MGFLLRLYDLVRRGREARAFDYLQRLFVFKKDVDLGMILIVRHLVKNFLMERYELLPF